MEEACTQLHNYCQERFLYKILELYLAIVCRNVSNTGNLTLMTVMSVVHFSFFNGNFLMYQRLIRQPRGNHIFAELSDIKDE